MSGPQGATGPQGPAGPATPDTRFGQNQPNLRVAVGRPCTLGEVWLVAGAFANGTPARGQLLPINQNMALFSLLGTTYGGDGRSNFALPDLRSSAPNDLAYVICTQGTLPGAS